MPCLLVGWAVRISTVAVEGCARGQGGRLFLINKVALLSYFSTLFFVAIFSSVPVDRLPRLLVHFFRGRGLSPRRGVVLCVQVPAILVAVLTKVSLSVSNNIVRSVARGSLIDPFALNVSTTTTFNTSLYVIFNNSMLRDAKNLVLNTFATSYLYVSLICNLSFGAKSTTSALILVKVTVGCLFDTKDTTVRFFTGRCGLNRVVR